MPRRSGRTSRTRASPKSSSSSPARATASDDPRRRPDRSRARGDRHARRPARRRRGRRRGLQRHRRVGPRRGPARPQSRGGRAGGHAPVRRSRGHQAHAHAGRVRGLLPARPRGALLHRQLNIYTDAVSERLERTDFQATSDPALNAGETKLLDYRQLYSLWERQHWAVQDIDFAPDRRDWEERIGPDERYMRMYGLSAFFCGEQRVAAELGPMMRAAPQEDMRIFLCTQIADEARHVAFFDRFYSEVGVLQADTLDGRLAETSEHLNPEFTTLFDELLRERVDRLAREPGDLEALVEAVTIYHMVIEGMLALTGQHFIIDYNEQVGTLPGFVDGFTKVARDEHRHIAFGVRFLRDMAHEDPRYAEAIQRTLVEIAPAADGVLRPKWMSEMPEDQEVFGATVAETREFAMKALDRRLKVIGLATAA